VHDGDQRHAGIAPPRAPAAGRLRRQPPDRAPPSARRRGSAVAVAAAGGRSPPSALAAREPIGARRGRSPKRPTACSADFGAAISSAGKQRVQLRQPVTRPRQPISTFSSADRRATRCRPCRTCPTSRRSARSAAADGGGEPLPEHLDDPGRRGHEAAEQSQQGRLAGAVVADDGDPLAGAHGERIDASRVRGRAADAAADDGDCQRQGRWRRRHHCSACRIRRLSASKEATSRTTTSRTSTAGPTGRVRSLR
jgi:hypothetical protein